MPIHLSNRNSFSNLPKRIILVRHGESEGNVDEAVFEHVPNYKIKLSKNGINQAHETGSKIREIVSENGKSKKWKVLFYVSPSNRTRETAEEIIRRGETFSKNEVMGLREECRLREQNFGNFQEVEERKKIKRIKNRYGNFFYRVPGGESSADVYDRVSTFVEGLWRDMESNKFSNNIPSDELNLIVVSHGQTILLFLMKWFNWTVDQFEVLINRRNSIFPGNCEYRVLQLERNGEYSLAVHHKVEELKEWGLSEEMIAEQKILAFGSEIHPNEKYIEDYSDGK